MSTTTAIVGWWQALAPRERAMLGVMFAAVGAFALWLGVVRPLQHARAAAVEHHDRAAAALHEVAAAADAIRALQARQPQPPAGDAFARTILDAAAAARVPVARQRGTEAGGLEIGIDAVAAPALLGWLETLRREHGIAPAQLDVTERNGALRVQASFTPPATQ